MIPDSLKLKSLHPLHQAYNQEFAVSAIYPALSPRACSSRYKNLGAHFAVRAGVLQGGSP